MILFTDKTFHPKHNNTMTNEKWKEVVIVEYNVIPFLYLINRNTEMAINKVYFNLTENIGQIYYIVTRNATAKSIIIQH